MCNGNILSSINDQHRHAATVFDDITGTIIVSRNQTFHPAAIKTASTSKAAKSNNSDDSMNEEEVDKLALSAKSKMIDELMRSM